MWRALFTSREVVVNPPTKETVYFIQGTLRVPLELPNNLKKNLPLVRQWVFDQIARLPLEEDPEYYTFKIFPGNFIYWYSLYDARRDGEECYGILMKWDSQEGAFTGVSNPDEELPQLEPPKKESRVEEEIVDKISDNNKDSNTSPKKRGSGEEEPTPLYKSKNTPKRNRRKK